MCSGRSVSKYAVSVKGVLRFQGKYLLRKNQRNEYELLGGRLEERDSSFEERLRAEFIEESGIQIQVVTHTEPWLYRIGDSGPVIITPFECTVKAMPDQLFDQDGGELKWFTPQEVTRLNMPQGYAQTISGSIPSTSYSVAEGAFPRVYTNYTEYKFLISVALHDEDGSPIACIPMDERISPRELIRKRIDPRATDVCLIAGAPSRIDDGVVLNYRLRK